MMTVVEVTDDLDKSSLESADFNTSPTLWGRYVHAHFIDKETERDALTRSEPSKWWGWDSTLLPLQTWGHPR